jgi:hypothetical protein
LSKVKALKSELSKSFVLKSDNNEFNPIDNHTDQLVTFLICQKLNFKLDELVDEISSFYDGTIAQERHNLVLSIEDGLLLYSSNGNTIPYPNVDGEPLKNRFISSNADEIHFKIFCSNLFLLTSSSTILFPEIAEYIGSGSAPVTHFDEN